MKFPSGVNSLIELAPTAQESLERLLERTLALLYYLRTHKQSATATELISERMENMKPLERSLRRALIDRTCEAQARAQAVEAWAFEMRCLGLWVLTDSHHIRTVSERTREHWVKAGESESMAEKERELEAMRPSALSLLAADDLRWLRENGFLREGE